MSRKIALFPTLKDVLKGSLQEWYQTMGFAALLSFVWFLVNLPFLILGFFILQFINQALNGTLPPGEALQFTGITLFLMALWNGLVAGPIGIALYGFSQKKKEDYLSAKIFFELLKKFYRRAAAIYSSFSLVLLMLVLNIGIALLRNQLLFTVIAVLSIYSIGIFLMMSYYFMPLIYLENSFRKLWRKSLILLLDNFWLTFFYGLALTFFFLLSTVVFILLPLAFGGFLIYLIDRGFQPIYDRYD